MSNDEILDMVDQCNLRDGKVLVPGEAYLFNQRFKINVSGNVRFEDEELIVLVKNGVKVGGIYRMGFENLHWVIAEKYRGHHILSGFLKRGIIEEIWPENTSVELCGIYFRLEYEKKKYLAQLCHMAIRNEEEIEERLAKMERHRLECERRIESILRN